MSLGKKMGAEFFGTFWLVLGGCGSAVLAAGFPELGIGFMGVAFAFGLTVLTMAYAVGHISGGHFNPAVSFGLWSAGKFETKDLLPYIGAQVIGGTVGALVLYLIATGQAGFEVGTRTIVDVLIAQQRKFQAQRDNSIARHAYILRHLRLKSIAGLLTSDDLSVVNQLLE